MLRSFLLFLLGWLTTSTLHAQHVCWDVKAGLTASTYQGGDVPNPRVRLGPTAGVLVRLPLGPHLDVQPELLYEPRGARSSTTRSYSGSSGSYRITHHERTRLHYASVPVLGRLHGAKWFAVAGPQGSYLLAAQQRVTDTSTLLSGVPDPNIRVGSGTSTTRSVRTYQRWELGYVLGVGYQLAPRLGVELRYAAGLTPLRHPSVPETGVPVIPADGVRNASLQAQVSYQFGAR